MYPVTQRPENALWLGRYRKPMPVRSRGSFHLVSVTRDEREDERSLVVMGSRSANTELVREALARIAEAHRSVEHPRVARVVELGEHEGVPFLELACDAVIEGTEFLRLLADAGHKLTYGQGDALFTMFREVLQVFHKTTCARTGKPYCLGRLSHANMLFSRSGKVWFVGLGHNFPVLKEDGRVEGLGSVWQAPEVLAGEEPTPVSDYVAILMIVRSVTAFCDIGEITKKLLQVAVSADSLEAFEIARWFETQFISQRPDARPTVEEGIARSNRLRAILGVKMDPVGLEARAAALIAEADGEPRDPGEGEIVHVADDAAWIAVGSGERRKLGRAHQNVLRALLLAKRHEPGRALGVWQLLDAGWPGEEPHPEVGANRVYVAIARLRTLGLRHVIERSGEGYRIAPDAPLKVAGSWLG